MFKNSKPDTIYLQCFINKKDLTSSEQTFVRDWVNLKHVGEWDGFAE